MTDRLHVQIPSLKPLLVSLRGQGGGQAEQARFVPKDSHHPGPSANLRMIVLDPVGGGQAPAMRRI